MKSLLIIRHAKSSWDSSTTRDFDRPLNDRGKRDAPDMAQRLLDRKAPIDHFVSSPAKRARNTSEYFIKAYDKQESDILFIPGLYHASAQTIMEVVSGFDNRFDCPALFSHNPGITEFVNLLTTVRIDNMPTCGIFGVTADIHDWSQFPSTPKSFWFFDFPKSAG